MLQLRKPNQRLLARLAAHFRRRPQPRTKGRALRLAKHLAAQFFIKLNTGYTGRLAIWHTGQWRSDGGRDATGGAEGAAEHGARLYPRERGSHWLDLPQLPAI